MSYKIAVLVSALAVISYCAAGIVVPALRDAPGPIVVHATGNGTYPSLDYVVNAIQTLQQATTIYADEAHIAEVYAALYKLKYPDHVWNVAVGYSTLYLNSSIFVEAIVSSGGQKLQKDKKQSGSLYMIFSSD